VEINVVPSVPNVALNRFGELSLIVGKSADCASHTLMPLVEVESKTFDACG